MPDLRGWILQQIDATEARARACPPWPTPDETDTEDYVDVEVRDARGCRRTSSPGTGQSPKPGMP